MPKFLKVPFRVAARGTQEFAFEDIASTFPLFFLGLEHGDPFLRKDERNGISASVDLRWFVTPRGNPDPDDHGFKKAWRQVVTVKNGTDSEQIGNVLIAVFDEAQFKEWNPSS